METIKNYIENLFLHLPATEETAKAKRELLTMMEDKYNELKAEGKKENEAVGIVISEFGDLNELGFDFGHRNMTEDGEDNEAGRTVTREEAEKYMEAHRKSSSWIGIGVMLCICSPLSLISLSGFESLSGAFEDWVYGIIGIPVLLVMIAIAVGIFIYQGTKMEPYEYLKNEPFYIDQSLKHYLEELKENKGGIYTVKIIAGVMLCILSVVPVIIIGTLFENAEFLQIIAVDILLLFIAIAVYLFITAGGEYDSLRVLLQEGDYTKKKKKNKKVTDALSGIYWSVVTLIYFLVSFFTPISWGTSWLIWPVAGIIYGIISMIYNALNDNSER